MVWYLLTLRQGRKAMTVNERRVSMKGVLFNVSLAKPCGAIGASKTPCIGFLDVTLREDECRIRRGEAAENFCTLRHFAFNLLKQEKTLKKSIKQKRIKAGWDD